MLSTVSDRKLASSTDGINVDFYDADVTSTTEYYPYGMTLRSESDGNNYRYGFQGQEDDPEVKGAGNSTNYKYRMHDPRIGRFFAVDPLAPKYPFYTPYSFSGNKVIQFIELEGLEEAPSGAQSGGSFGAGVWDGFIGYFVDIGEGASTFEFWVGPATLSGLGEALTSAGTSLNGAEIAGHVYNGNYYEAGRSTGEIGAEGATILATEGALKGIKTLKGDKKTTTAAETSADVQQNANSNTNSTQNNANTNPGSQTATSAEGLGGKHGTLINDVNAAGRNTTEKHHMPANSTNEVSTYSGGSIKMDKLEHRRTASWGSSIGANEFRAMQRAWQESGNFQRAFEMDVRDVRSKFGNKYDQHINQLIEYYKSIDKLDADYSI